jgi:ethanolamine ammonia-lyase small subunit
MNEAWLALRQSTPARIALGNAGSGLPTGAHLDFQMAHARARDAVAHVLDVARVSEALSGLHGEVLPVRTRATDHHTYLADPHSGSLLDAESAARAAALAAGCDVMFVCADGLSAAAIELHAAPLLTRVLPALSAAGWKIGPLLIATGGRVALGDDVGERLRARFAVVLIGERPGLSAPDSLGVYITYEPRIGRTNAERNCISNIRPQGLAYDDAAGKLMWILTQARARGVTGVALKDASAL